MNSLNAQLSDINRQLNNIVNAIANGIYSKTTNEKLNNLEQQKEDMEIMIAEHQVKKIKPLDVNIVYKWFISFADVDITDTLACKRMIDLFVNKVILYDDYFDIVFNASEDNTHNIKLENVEDYTNLENQLNDKKEQPELSGSDCSHLVRMKGLEPPRSPTRS